MDDLQKHFSSILTCVVQRLLCHVRAYILFSVVENVNVIVLGFS